jgi:hypothetical protein
MKKEYYRTYFGQNFKKISERNDKLYNNTK